MPNPRRERVGGGVTLISALVALLLLLAPAQAGCASLALVGQKAGERTVTMLPMKGGGLGGQLVVAVKNPGKKAGLTVSFYANGEAAGKQAGSVALAEGESGLLAAEQISSIGLVAELSAGADPASLKGIALLQPTRGGKALGQPLELELSGVAANLKDVNISPEKLAIKLDDATPWSPPGEASAGVQLSGPGVARMFAAGASPPGFDLLLHSDNGDEAQARIEGLAQSGSDPNLASGELRVEGDLGPGKFEGSGPISSVGSEAPKLSVTVESGVSALYPVLLLLAGAICGGALYLASGRKRRKLLLRDQLKSILASYLATLKRLRTEEAEGQLQPWTLESYLGPQANWYTVKWNAIVNFDGAVQTIWSDIHWARSEEDLDAVAAEIGEARERIVRWITVANGISDLQRARRLRPKSIPAHPWASQQTPKDTGRLIEEIREIEPADEAASKARIERVQRQAVWHRSLAEVWHAHTVLENDMKDDNPDYSNNDRTVFEGIDLLAIDQEGAEEKRTAEKQVELKLKLNHCLETIRETYKGEPADLRLPEPDGGTAAPSPNPMLALFAGAAPGNAAVGEAVVKARLSEVSRGEEELTGEARAGAAGKDKGEGDAAALLKRDFVWTMAVALASAIVYMPTIYDATWGTGLDYVSAFAVGFAGKLVVNWAALPLFGSVRAGSQAAAGETKKGAGAATTAGAKAGA